MANDKKSVRLAFEAARVSFVAVFGGATVVD